ncbi:hypothetical protein PSI19_17970 [Xenorhabdus khoisanae]|uniref:hypothetical protein n=1 Tax=Xenorhabdus khoisanae TaxID=880157 RepID=UPI002359B794|nr:hypothetical protein [Xenorhabdus khoisanae]MDC9615720.1 hypothetical protein [Xenorhabdus khoisanae]
MRYICALLEADIIGHITQRFDDESFPVLFVTGYLHNRAEHSLPHAERYRFNRYNVHLHFAFITINVLNIARRHLC